MKVKVSELRDSHIITTLVGGLCAGQRVSESLFDGRQFIYAAPNRLPTYSPQPEDPALEVRTCLYELRKASHPARVSFVAFVDPGTPDSEFFSACESLRKQTHPDWFAE